MTDYRGGGLTNMKIRQVEKDLEKMRSEIEEKKKEIENKPRINLYILCSVTCFKAHTVHSD